MNSKSFSFKNLNTGNIIRISSNNSVIDFLKESTHVAIYYNSNKTGMPIEFYAERLIYENNQSHGKSFEVSVTGNEVYIEITAITQYDAQSLMALLL